MVSQFRMSPKNYNTRLNCYSIRQHHYDRLLISLHYVSLKNVELILGVAILLIEILIEGIIDFLKRNLVDDFVNFLNI